MSQSVLHLFSPTTTRTCSSCRASKIKCVFEDNNFACNNCLDREIPCVPRKTKKRGRSNLIATTANRITTTAPSTATLSTIESTKEDQRILVEMISNMAADIVANSDADIPLSGESTSNVLKQHAGLNFLARMLYCSGMHNGSALTVAAAFRVVGKMGLSLDEFMLHNKQQFTNNPLFLNLTESEAMMKKAAQKQVKTTSSPDSKETGLLPIDTKEKYYELASNSNSSWFRRARLHERIKPLKFNDIPIALRNLMLGINSNESVLDNKMVVVQNLSSRFGKYQAYHSKGCNEHLITHEEARLLCESPHDFRQTLTHLFPSSEQKKLGMLVASAICQHQNPSLLPSKPSTMSTMIQIKTKSDSIPIYCTFSTLIISLTNAWTWFEITPIPEGVLKEKIDSSSSSSSSSSKRRRTTTTTNKKKKKKITPIPEGVIKEQIDVSSSSNSSSKGKTKTTNNKNNNNKKKINKKANSQKLSIKQEAPLPPQPRARLSSSLVQQLPAQQLPAQQVPNVKAMVNNAIHLSSNKSRYICRLQKNDANLLPPPFAPPPFAPPHFVDGPLNNYTMNHHYIMNTVGMRSGGMNHGGVHNSSSTSSSSYDNSYNGGLADAVDNVDNKFDFDYKNLDFGDIDL